MSSPPHLNLRTTADVIRHSSISFLSTFHTFLILSLLLFSFRNTVENGTRILISFIDKDPSVKALISRLTSDSPSDISRHTLAGKDRTSDSLAPDGNLRHRRRRSFLQLSRVGTLDDDFFSDNDDDSSSDRSSLFRHRRSPTTNGTFVKLGVLRSEKGSGVRVLEIAGSGLVFVTDGVSFDDDGERNETGISEQVEEEDPPFGLWFLGRNGFELERHELAALVFLVSFLSAAYGWVILGFLFSYCYALGVVFFAVVNSHLGTRNSVFRTIRAGSRLGIRRVVGFALLRWAVRDALTQFLGLWFFSDVEDQYFLFKLFVQLKLMPFSVASSPWIQDTGFGLHASGFLFSWVILDTFLALIFAVDCWVAIIDTRMSGQEILKEGCYLMLTMLNQAIAIKCLEFVFCGSIARQLVARFGGNLIALFFQSVAEVYFMVVWLIFYFAVRCKDAELEGRTFGQRDLEDCINDVR